MGPYDTWREIFMRDFRRAIKARVDARSNKHHWKRIAAINVSYINPQPPCFLAAIQPDTVQPAVELPPEAEKIYTLKASGQQFRVVGNGSDYARIVFVGGRKNAEQTILIKDLAANSDWKPAAEPEKPKTEHQHDYGCLYGCPYAGGC